ncbi:MAG: DUF480 domain-containing protein [Elusimicrobia bacterium]|nr:DUF480 domain-containing protein [Elusimicrobiota bacterium]
MTELNEIEARVLGSLIEKAFSTPDQYPLSYNALVNACNQKTSRDPVMNLEPEAVGTAVASLVEKGLAAKLIGDRVPKVAHRAEGLGAGESPEVIGTLGLLLLRGAQTAAEIRVRTERIAQFPNTEAAEAQLQKLAAHPSGPFVARLSRGRYQHLFSGPAAEAASRASEAADRLAQLEARVAALEAAVQDLQTR